MRRSVAPGSNQGDDLRDRLTTVQALVREVTALGEAAEALVRELEAERAKDTPLCSINEAARRLGKNYHWVRALFDSNPGLAQRVLVPNTPGDVVVKWPALQAWLCGELLEGPADPGIVHLRSVR